MRTGWSRRWRRAPCWARRRSSVNGNDYGTVRLVNHAEVELATGEFMRLRLREFFSNGWVIAILAIVLVMAVAYIALVTRYRRLRRRHLKERRRAEQRRRLRPGAAARRAQSRPRAST